MFQHFVFFFVTEWIFLLFFVVSLIIHIFTAVKAYKRYQYNHSALTHHDIPDHAAQRRKPNTWNVGLNSKWHHHDKESKNLSASALVGLLGIVQQHLFVIDGCKYPCRVWESRDLQTWLCLPGQFRMKSKFLSIRFGCRWYQLCDR